MLGLQHLDNRVVATAVGQGRVQRGFGNHGGCGVTQHYRGRVRAQHLLLFSKLSNTCSKELSIGRTNGNHQRLARVQWTLGVGGSKHNAIGCHGEAMRGCQAQCTIGAPLAILTESVMSLTTKLLYLCSPMPPVPFARPCQASPVVPK